jgi:hypothetical protein
MVRELLGRVLVAVLVCTPLVVIAAFRDALAIGLWFAAGITAFYVLICLVAAYEDRRAA